MKKINKFICGAALAFMAVGVTTAFVSSHNSKAIKVHAEGDVDLADVISFQQASFSYDFIDNAFVQFAFSDLFWSSDDAAVHSNGCYLNDHLNVWTDENGDHYNIGDGIMINGKTFSEWVALDDATLDTVRVHLNTTNRVMAFPMSVGGKYAPVALEFLGGSKYMEFKFNLDLFPSPSIEITFLKDKFYGYRDGVHYTLSEDLTFFSSLDVNDAEFSKWQFVREDNAVLTDLGVEHVDNWSQQADHPENMYVVWTNIPRNKSAFSAQPNWSDHYRYFYDSVSLEGRSLTWWNSFGRGNYIDLNSDGTVNTAYMPCHPAIEGAYNYHYAINPTIVLDQDNFVFFVHTSPQFAADLGIEGTPDIQLIEGSLFHGFNSAGEAALVRYAPTRMAELRTAAKAEVSSYLNPAGYTREAETVASIISEANTALDGVHLSDSFASVVATYQARLGEVKSDAQYEAEELAAAKESAINELNAIDTNSLFRTTERQQANNIRNNAIEAISAATSIESVNGLLADAQAAIGELKTADEYEHEEFDAAKEAAFAELDSYKDPSNYREAQQQELADIINNAKYLINNLNYKNKLQIQVEVDAAKELMDAVKTSAQLDEEEAQVVLDMIYAVPAVTPQNYLEVEAQINEAWAAYRALTPGAQDIVGSVPVALEEKEARIAELKAVQPEADNVIALIDAIGDDMYGNASALQKINAAREAYDGLSADGKSLVPNYEKLQSAESTFSVALANAKTSAKQDLEGYKNSSDYRSAEQGQLATIVNDGKSAIDAATTTEGVNSALASAKAQADALKTAAQYDAEELAAAKTAAKAELEEEFASYDQGKYSKKGVEELEAAKANGLTAIDAANSIDAVNAALASAKEALAAVKVKKSGCGGSILATSAIITLIATAGAALIFARKKED